LLLYDKIIVLIFYKDNRVFMKELAMLL